MLVVERARVAGALNQVHGASVVAEQRAQPCALTLAERQAVRGASDDEERRAAERADRRPARTREPAEHCARVARERNSEMHL